MSAPAEIEQPDTNALAAVAIARYPALRGASVTVSNTGFDSVALTIGGMTFKFPRDNEAKQRLHNEASILDAIRPKLAMPVPRMTLHTTPQMFSAHATLPGKSLLSADYLRLTTQQRERLAYDLSLFFAQTHAIDRTELGAVPLPSIDRWRPLELIAAEGLPLLPPNLRGPVEAQLKLFADLPPDPLGNVYGHFDSHGWNMAFDVETGRLNGIFDFADSGFAPAHEEWMFPSMIHPELALRSMDTYATITGRVPDPARARALSTVQRLDDLAGADEFPAMAPLVRQIAFDWFQHLAAGTV